MGILAGLLTKKKDLEKFPPKFPGILTEQNHQREKPFRLQTVEKNIPCISSDRKKDDETREHPEPPVHS